MSRSYKKPYAGDKKSNKQYANKRVRNILKDSNAILNHKSYRKAFPTYEICDYWNYCPYTPEWHSKMKKYHPDWSDKAIYNQWCKWFKRK